MKMLYVFAAIFALLGGMDAQAVTIQENKVFPDVDVIASQLEYNSQLFVADQSDGAMRKGLHGQTFTLDAETTLRAVTLQSFHTLDPSWINTGDEIMELWIGENLGTESNHVSGATRRLATGISITGMDIKKDHFYTFNLDSDLVLPAGDYCFQLRFEGPGLRNLWRYNFANAIGTYEGGGLVSTGNTTNFPLNANIGQNNDLVFGLHTTPISRVPTIEVDPGALDITLPGADAGTGTVSIAYDALTTVDIELSITEESHPGSFSVLSATPQTLPTPAPDTTELEFEFDNTVANLSIGQTATGLIVIAYSDTGSGVTYETRVPVSATTGFAPDEENEFTAAVGTWDNTANWALGRVPGTEGSDWAILQAAGAVCNVDTNFVGAPFSWKTYIRTGLGAPAVLNIGADFKGSSEIQIGYSDSSYGILNQTTGGVDCAYLRVGDAVNLAPSNSYYNLTGGRMDMTGKIDISQTGVLHIDGGTFRRPGVSTILGGGLLKLDSGTFHTGDNNNNSDYLKVNVEITGGTFQMLSQLFFAQGVPVDFTIIGDDADVTIRHLVMPANSQGTLKWVLDETGVSTLKGGAWWRLDNPTVAVDGSAYAGGSQTIKLIDGTTFAAIPESAITVTGFDAAYTVTVSNAVNELTLNIVSGDAYLGWVSDYGLSGTNAAKTAHADDDMYNNYYEYVFGGDPTNGAFWGYDGDASSVVDGGTTYFEYVYARRIGSESELDYSAEIASSLVLSNWTADGVVELPTTGTIDESYESVTNRVDTTGKPVGMMRTVVDEL